MVIVPGATDGLGKGLACALAELGATVLLHGRSEARLADTAAEILASAPTAEVRTYRADFGTLTEVADMAATIREREPRLDVLVSNAGVGFPPQRLESAHGYELVFQVNHLAGYLLVRDLSELHADETARRLHESHDRPE